MNLWAFTGNLGGDCETRHTPKGDAVVSFSVGVKSGYGDKATTTWARCALWGKRGESVAPYLTKGQLVGITGEVTLREYDLKDGSKGKSLEVRVADLTLLGKADAGGARPPPATRDVSTQSAPYQDDDIPFN